jgi:hypothetical protein
LREEGFDFTAPQLDHLFQKLDVGKDGFLDLKEWTYKIYDNFNNPIQLIREIAMANEISGEDILHKFKMRVYDDPIEFPKFKDCMKMLDPELNPNQLRCMFNEIKNSSNLVEIPMMIASITGETYETVDFRNKVYKQIWNFIEKKKLEQKMTTLLDVSLYLTLFRDMINSMMGP